MRDWCVIRFFCLFFVFLFDFTTPNYIEISRSFWKSFFIVGIGIIDNGLPIYQNNTIFCFHFTQQKFPNGMNPSVSLTIRVYIPLIKFHALISFAVSYEMTSIKYVWKNDEDVLRKSPSLTTLNAYLINNSTLICPTKSSWRGKNYFHILSLIHIFIRVIKLWE